MSRLVAFYGGLETDTEGRYLSDILAWPDREMEAVHDFIQWLFPLPEPSRFNPDAPLLSDEDIAAFHSDAVIQANLRKSFERILTFLGLSLSASGDIVEGRNFQARIADVWAVPNHTWLRITRILRSLTLLGMKREAKALYDRLSAFHTSGKFRISAETFRYWTQAVA